LIDSNLLKNVNADYLQNSVQTFRDLMDLLETGHQQVSANRNPYLGLHGIFSVPVEPADAEVLFDPLEKELYLPTALIKLSDGGCGEREVIGQENQSFTGFRINEADAPEPFGVDLFALGRFEPNNLVTSQPVSFIHRVGTGNVELEVDFGSGHKEGVGLANSKKAFEIDVSSVDYVDASSLKLDFVQEVDVMDLSSADADKDWDGALNLHLSVHFDGRLGLSEMSPWEQRQTQIDRGGIDRIDHLIQVQIHFVAGIETLRLSDEDLRQGFVGSPITVFIGVGQVGSGHIASNAHGMEVFAAFQARFNISKAIPKGELGEDHTKELISRSHCLTGSWHWIPADATLKFLAVDEIRNLRKNQPSSIHLLLRLNF
jgi:hypothetical protein